MSSGVAFAFVVGSVSAVTLWFVITKNKNSISNSLAFKLGYALFNSPLGFVYFRFFHYVNVSSDKKNAPNTLLSSSRLLVRDKNIVTVDNIIIRPIPFGLDNIAYVIADIQSNECVLVDPGDPLAVLDTIYFHYPDIDVKAILTTHRHWDHAAGNLFVAKKVKEMGGTVKVFGSRVEFKSSWYDQFVNYWCVGVSHFLNDGDIFEIGRLKFTAIQSNFHTRGGLVYLFHHPTNLEELNLPKSSPSLSSSHKLPTPEVSPSDIDSEDDMVVIRPRSAVVHPITSSSPQQASIQPQSQQDVFATSSLFTGDSLFVCGCGKFFEGSAVHFHNFVKITLAEYIKKNEIAMNSLIWPGHEYAVTNLAFAKSVEPGNFMIQMKDKDANEAVFTNSLLVPSIFEMEVLTNPFLRVDFRNSGISKTKAKRGPFNAPKKSTELWENITLMSSEFLDQVRKSAVFNGSKDISESEQIRNEETVIIGCLRVLKN
ncbi:hypothetical protein HK096_007837, partial [Nowakowskiella sp. JEL0078]